MKFDAEAEKRCILTTKRITTSSGAWLVDMLYGIPGEYHFISKLVRNEEEARSEVETFKLKHRGELK